ncbi:MAG: endonuclease [Modestobacter sp.]|nr:endonuclease [Modestobacter sp.]MCW2617383.1 endonuclease [Modestobacter sp.]
MGEVQSALDALAAEDLKPMFGPQLLERLRGLVQLQNRVAAEVTRTVRECELTQAAETDGLKTMQSWLRGHAHLAPQAAGQLVRSGRALEHLPAVAAAFAEGSVTAGQVALIAPIVGEQELAAAAERDVDLGAIEESIVAVAQTRPHDTLAQVVHRYREALDPDGPEPDPTEGRRFTFSTRADGSGSGRFDLDAVGFEKVRAVIESMVQAARPKGDTRTRAQQQADALVQWADNTLASGDLPVLRTVKPHLIVTIDVEDLLDPSTGRGAAETGFGATISAARARWAACDATISRLVLDPDGLPLDLGREKRVVPPHLRRAVERRDRHCVFVGCGAPTHWCDVHHLLEWINGGETSLENSALLCERHHTKVHHGFRVDRDDTAPPGSRWRTYRPDGSEILIPALA